MGILRFFMGILRIFTGVNYGCKLWVATDKKPGYFLKLRVDYAKNLLILHVCKLWVVLSEFAYVLSWKGISLNDNPHVSFQGSTAVLAKDEVL